jgi:hypothetical protein
MLDIFNLDLSFDFLEFLIDPVFWLTAVLVVITCIGLFFLGKKLYHRFSVLVRQASYEKKSLDAVVFEIRVPKNNEVEAQAADQMFSNLLAIGSGDKDDNWKDVFKANSFISFEIVAFPQSIKFYVVASKGLTNIIEKTINGSYAAAEVIKKDEYNIFAKNCKVEFAQLKLDSDNYKPIKTYEEMTTDSMASLLATMSKLAENEAVVYQVIITNAKTEWRNKGKSYVKGIRDAFSDPEKKKKPSVSEDVLASIEKKCEKGGFSVDIRFIATAPTKDAAKNHIDTLISLFSQFKKVSGNSFKKDSLNGWEKLQFLKNFLYRIPEQKMILNTEELATVMHLPNNKVESPNISWLMAKRAPADGAIPSTGDLWIGNNIFRDVSRPIFIERDDRRRHMYIIGKTGTGKSYYMQAMALQDMENGEGLAFLDPHGDSAEWLLERIPANRIEDVIYWNPGDIERPMGFNIIEAYSEQDKHRVVNSFLGLMTKMFDPHNQGITGPIFERSVRNAMLTVMEVPGATLVEVLRILSDQKYANSIIPNIKDPVVKRYWTDEVANTQEFHKSEKLGYIVSKFDRFVTNKLTRNIFGQSKSAFNIRWLMDNKKILIVNLSKGILGEENAQFLGLLLVPKILSAAMSRADIPQEQRKDFYLYVDEFQNFSTEDFAQILSEARKYRLNLIVANQYISQIDEKIRDAVFGNVGTAITMKVGSADAQFLEQLYTPIFNSTDLVNQENGNAYMKMINKGETPPAFSINTRYETAPIKIPEGNYKTAEIVRSLSRYRFGRDVAMVEAEINQRGNIFGEKPADGSPTGMGSDTQDIRKSSTIG